MLHGLLQEVIGSSRSSPRMSCAAQALNCMGRMPSNLPDLARMPACDESFDVVMLTAVWMHLDELERRRAMPRLASLLAPDGVLVMSIRYGLAPSERRIFDVSDEDAVALASNCSLKNVLALRGRHPWSNMQLVVTTARATASWKAKFSLVEALRSF
ncbi:class I SAM-dependent methyltransferase [Variovorax sp. GT1P44]|uniref:class I SAM-dependent methyltransferase n=1 Tax=Variovorax sp. GT1P44 TaxID=3443742 RepID=UPI003F46AF4B